METYLFTVEFRVCLCLNSSFSSADSEMSLNMPSSFVVNCAPHSVRSFLIMLFSDSSDSDYFSLVFEIMEISYFLFQKSTGQVTLVVALEDVLLAQEAKNWFSNNNSAFQSD